MTLLVIFAALAATVSLWLAIAYEQDLGRPKCPVCEWPQDLGHAYDCPIGPRKRGAA